MEYITFCAVMAFIFALVVTMLIGGRIICYLRQKKIGDEPRDLTVKCKVGLSEKISVFSIKTTYRGVVVVNFSLPDEKIRECLNIFILQELYEYIREVVYSVSMHSGLTPIEMDYYS